MHSASKSASSGRHKVHVRFYLKSDRFGHFWASGRFECIRSDFGTCRAAETFWASEWFEGILKAPELRNHEKRCKNLWIWAFVTKSLCFLWFFNTFIKNVVISLDVCKKCSVTWLELLKKHVNSCGFLAFLKQWICDALKKHWNLSHISTKVLRVIDGVIENTFILPRFSNMFEIMNS